MSARKPLDPGCDGGIFCAVEGHVSARNMGGMVNWSHIPLTVGQNKALRERWRIEEARTANKESK